ncbi:MAG: hypothetical protein ACUVSM_06550 [Armatimonadota bacterium]
MKRHLFGFIGMLTIALAGGAADGRTAPGAGGGAPARPVLVFSVDQGFGNGIVVHDDQVALTRIIRALEPLRQRFDVRVIVNPMVRDRARLLRTLDTLAARGMPFTLEAWSSDAQTLGSCSEQNNPFDPHHGLTVSTEELGALKRRYGRMFTGIRFAEVFAQDFTVRAVRTTNPEWGLPCWKLPADSFFRPDIARRLLGFARANRLHVQWSDWHWYTFHPWDETQRGHEEELRALLREFPGLVTMTYANNEPQEESALRRDHWEKAVKGFVSDGAAGFGLSCQSWLRLVETDTVPEELAGWAVEALERGASLVQFEPVWYFFHLPRGTFGVERYTHLPEWADRGRPRDSFRVLERALLDWADGRLREGAKR